jgi:pilus assembly protein CpaD
MRFLQSSASWRPAQRTGARLRAGAVIGVVALSLGACANARTDEALRTGSVDLDGYKTRHPIVLTESAETLDVPVGMQSAGLTSRMAHTIAIFAENARRHGAAGITILVPTGGANLYAADKVAKQAAGALAQGGFPRNAISLTGYDVPAGAADAPVRIAYARVKAMVTHRCGVWPEPVGGGNFDNRDDWDLGCATQSNIAAMVANPEDLVTPTGDDPADGTRRTTIITKYRAGTQTKAETGAKGAAIADSVQGGN